MDEKLKAPPGESILDDDALLESANMALFEAYDMKVEINNEKVAEAFEEKAEVNELIEATLARKKEALEKIQLAENDELESRRERRANLDSSSRLTAAATSSSSTTTTNTASSRYGYGTTPATSSSSLKTMIQAAEERSTKLTDRASKAAKEAVFPATGKRSARNKKRSVIDKVAPKGSRRKKALIIGSAMLLETAVSALFLTQSIAKNHLYAKLGGLDGTKS